MVTCSVDSEKFPVGAAEPTVPNSVALRQIVRAHIRIKISLPSGYTPYGVDT